MVELFTDSGKKRDRVCGLVRDGAKVECRLLISSLEFNHLFKFSFFFFFRAASVAFGGSEARDLFGATAASLCH